jgi:hypothetical protein
MLNLCIYQKANASEVEQCGKSTSEVKVFQRQHHYCTEFHLSSASDLVLYLTLTIKVSFIDKCHP